MSAWRRIALERFPEHRQSIQSADSIMALWIELGSAFHRAYETEPLDDHLIRRLYDYAWWCLEESTSTGDASTDPATAVIVAFFEHLPDHDAARSDMPRWLTPVAFEAAMAYFAYGRSASELDALRAEFHGKPIARRRGARKTRGR